MRKKLPKRNSAAKAGIGYTIGNLLIKGISFFTLPIFTRLMSTADYGLYTTYVSYEGIIGIVVGLGLHMSLKAAKIDYKEKLDNYVSTVSCIPIAFSLFLIIILIPHGSFINRATGFSSIILYLMVGQAWASSVLMVYNARVGLNFDYLNYIRISIIGTVLNIALSLLFILFVTPDQPFFGRILGTSLPFIGIGVALTILFFHRAKPKDDKEMIKYGLKYSLPLIPHGLSQQIMSQFGKIIIQQKVGNDAAGIYGFAYTIALIPQILFTSLDTVWGPWFFERYSENKIDLIKEKAIYYVVLFSIISIGLICVSPEIISIMGDASYYSSRYIICPAILGVYFTFLYGIPVQIEYYYKKTNYIAAGTMVTAGINIVACLNLIPRFGYGAAVYITMIIYALYFIVHLVIAYRITKGELPFEIKRMLLYSISVCIVMALAQVFVDQWIIRWLLMFAAIIVISLLNKRVIRMYLGKVILMIRQKME